MQNNKSIYINSVVSVQRSAYTWICIDSIWSFTKFHPTYIKILKFQSISVHISSDDDKMENMKTETPLQYSCTFEKKMNGTNLFELKFEREKLNCSYCLNWWPFNDLILHIWEVHLHQRSDGNVIELWMQ